MQAKTIGAVEKAPIEKMLTIENTVISISNTYRCFPLHKNGRRNRAPTSTSARKRDFPDENPKTNLANINFPLKKLPRNLLAQSAITVFALGFVDAGYSGDWSRIGVISKESEELLKSAAFFVVPFCIFIVFSFSNKLED